MKGAKSILISGASVAGPTLAYWLRRFGFDPVLVERAPALRRGGHAIDVRGVALDILAAMGILDAVQDHRTTMAGVSMVDRDGGELWRSEAMTITGGRFEAQDIEILRDELSELLHGALPGDVEILFGDSIAALAQDEDGVTVEFERSAPRRFDLVIGADGMRSNVRDLAFGREQDFLRPLGTALAVFSAPNHLGLEDWQLSYREEPQNCLVYPARRNSELRVSVGFAAEPSDVPRDRAGQLALVREKCGPMAWHVPRFLDAMEDAEDFYLGALAQVLMPCWSTGRIALVGDAAYCPSPYSGQGTSLSLVGAYRLAWELAHSSGEPCEAFARWEAAMRPFVAQNQAIADMSLDPRFHEPDYHATIQDAIEVAKCAIQLDGLKIYDRSAVVSRMD